MRFTPVFAVHCLLLTAQCHLMTLSARASTFGEIVGTNLLCCFQVGDELKLLRLLNPKWPSYFLAKNAFASISSGRSVSAFCASTTSFS